MNNIQRDPFLTQYVPLLLAVLPGCMVILQLLGVPFINSPEIGIPTSLVLLILAVTISGCRTRRLTGWCSPALGVMAFEVVRWWGQLYDKYYRVWAYTYHGTSLGTVFQAMFLIVCVIVFVVWPIALGVVTWKARVSWPATALLLLAFMLISGIFYNSNNLTSEPWYVIDAVYLLLILTPPLLCLRWLRVEGAAAAALVITFVPAWLECLFGLVKYTDATESIHAPTTVVHIVLMLIACVVFLIVLPTFMLTLVGERRRRQLLKWIPPLIVLLSILMVFTSLLGVEPERLTYLFSIETIVKIVRMVIPMYIFMAIYDDGRWRSISHNLTF